MSTDSPSEPFTEEDGVLYDEEVTPQQGVVGVTLRELLIVGVWLVVFVTSFFAVGASPTLWVSGIVWILPLGLPTIAVFLIVLRRFSPEGIRRVGSLGIDQFASVAFSVALLWWAQVIWDLISTLVQTGTAMTAWVPWVQFAGMLALVVLTVFAPVIPGLKEDFRGRLVTLAHRNANPVRPVLARPRAERAARPVATEPAVVNDEEVVPDEEPVVVDEDPVSENMNDSDDELEDTNETDVIAHLGLGDSIPTSSHASGGQLGIVPDADADEYVPAYARRSRDVEETAPREPVFAHEPAAESVMAEPVAQESSQPFWALAPTERDVVDERGEPLFRVGPTAWALVIEDRGGAYVMRHDDGRVGYLHDISDITKG